MTTQVASQAAARVRPVASLAPPLSLLFFSSLLSSFLPSLGQG